MNKKELLNLIESNSKILKVASEHLSIMSEKLFITTKTTEELEKRIKSLEKQLFFEGRDLNENGALDRTVLIVDKLLDYLKLDLKAELIDDPCYKQETPKVKSFKIIKK